MRSPIYIDGFKMRYDWILSRFIFRRHFLLKQMAKFYYQKLCTVLNA